MEWITALWQRVSQPVPNFLIGLVFLNYAPKELSWIGLIFIAISSQGFLEYTIKFLKWIARKLFTFRNNQKIEKKLNNLTVKEAEALILVYMLKNVKLRPYDFLETNPRNKIELAGYLEKLEMWDLIYSFFNESYADPFTTCYLKGAVRYCLKKRLEKEMDTQC